MTEALPTNFQLLINGRFVDGSAGSSSVFNPSTGKVFAQAPDAGEDQVAEAIWAAREAQPKWGMKAPLERAAIMRQIAKLIRRDAELLATVLVMEQGKPINEARGEVAEAAEFFDYFAEFARRIQGEILPSDFPGEQIWIQRVPVGVVVAILPWNYPCGLVSRKVAPALIAGNTIVVKPHEETPLTALMMMRLFVEAGVPDGVVNVVSGAGETVGAGLVGRPDVDLITMTGSVATGKRIMSSAAGNLTAVSLELGGKAPFIVMDDADMEHAVAAAVTSRYMNCGQVCVCNERTLVHHSRYDEFVERFIAMTRTLTVGDPMKTTTDIGPKISSRERDKVEKMLAKAVADGAEIALGGGRPQREDLADGFFMNPTVLTNVTPDMDIMTDEIFGPIVPIMPFDTFEEAVAIANNSRYGLSAYLFTNDFSKIMAAVSDVSFGEIYVNRSAGELLQAYHVGYRESGPGGDDGVHGLDKYLRKKTVYVNYSGKPTAGLMPFR